MERSTLSTSKIIFFLLSAHGKVEYKGAEGGTKHPFVPSSCSPSSAFYMRAASSSIAGIIGAEPTIEWFPRLSPHMDGSAFSGHYLGSRVVRPLNGLPHEPFLDPHRTVRAPHIDRLPNIRHRVDANASFVDGRLWMSDVPSRRFTWSVRTYM